jgi:O-antigen/teichoic acid export membrane protein
VPHQPKNPSDSGPERFLRVDHLSSDLRRRSLRGGAVTISNQGGKFLITLAAMAILARILTPADFGLLDMVIAIVGFVSIFKDLGLAMATVQRREVNQGQVSTLFWINVLVSLVLVGVLAALAPLLGWYYKEPRVVPIALALAGSVAFSGLTVQHQALLRRQMRFAAIALIELTAIVTSYAIAISLALSDIGYWSLVTVPIVREFVMMLGVWLACGWRPGPPMRRSGVRSMLSFGAHLTGFNIANYVHRNLDKILIGRYFGATSLGIYAKAYQLLLLPIHQINNPITSVAVPALSRLQDQPERYRRFYRRGVFLTVAVSMPAVAFLCVAAERAVLTLLGDQWLGCVPIFRALAPSAFLGSFNVATGWIYISLGRTKRQFGWGVFSSIVIAAAFIVGLRWGPIGVAATYSAAVAALRFPGILYCFAISPVTLRDLGLALWRSTAASLGAGLVLFGVNRAVELGVPALLNLIIDLGIFGLAYIVIWVAMPGGRKSLGEVMAIARDIRPAGDSPTQQSEQP